MPVIGRELPIRDLVSRVFRGLTLLLAIAVDVGVRQDPVQPGLEIRSLAERPETGIGLDHGLLQQVLGIRRIARHPQRTAVQLVQQRNRVAFETRGEFRIGLIVRALWAVGAPVSVPRCRYPGVRAPVSVIVVDTVPSASARAIAADTRLPFSPILGTVLINNGIDVPAISRRISCSIGVTPCRFGKTMFISGASRGIGLAIAKRVAAEGANIALIAKTAEPHPCCRAPSTPPPGNRGRRRSGLADRRRCSRR